MIRAKVISFTERGAKTGQRIAAALSGACVEQYARNVDLSLQATKLSRLVQQAMVDCDLILFVGATGIAVRACAPYLQGKQYDPAILVIDENARFVISLLSGHLGGANALADRLARDLQAQPVITTATDNRGIFAVDTWAKNQNYTVYEVPQIKYISGALLKGDTVGIQSDFPVEGDLPEHIYFTDKCQCGIVLSVHVHQQPFLHTLHLVPKIIHMGIGCRRGIPYEKIETAAQNILSAANIPLSAIKQVATIDIKKDELGLCQFCQRHQIPLITYSAQQLIQASGNYTGSDFVQSIVGVDNVCERAAVLSSQNGMLLYRKTAVSGVTIALAVQDWRVQF